MSLFQIKALCNTTLLGFSDEKKEALIAVWYGQKDKRIKKRPHIASLEGDRRNRSGHEDAVLPPEKRTHSRQGL